MNKIITIALHEFIETVRTKTFFLSVVLMPLLIMGFIYGARWIDRVSEKEKLPLRRIGLVDQSGAIADRIEAQVKKYNADNARRPLEVERVAGNPDREALAARVRSGDLYAYIIVPADVVDGSGRCLLGRRDNRLEEGKQLRNMLQTAVVAERFAHSDVDRSRIDWLQREVGIETFDAQTNQKATNDELARTITPFAFMFLLFIGTMGISQGLLTSLIEEKSSRVMEVLLSAVSPVQLMAGKIIGMTLVGATLLLVWGTLGYYSAQRYEMGYLVGGYRLGYAALYFLPSFLMMSAALAGIGSACNTLKEAQSMTFPVSLMNIVPMLLWMQISQNPGSALSLVLSFVPPITPYVMILRICADPDTPVWQIVSTLVLLWASVAASIWVAAKVFRVGVLMYGKPPSIRELARWVKYA